MPNAAKDQPEQASAKPNETKERETRSSELARDDGKAARLQELLRKNSAATKEFSRSVSVGTANVKQKR